MNYLIGAVVGLLAGGTVAFLKDKLLWDSYLKKDPGPMDASGVLIRSFISFFVNVLALSVVFVLRDALPFSWVACIVAVAAALSALGPYQASRREVPQPKEQ